jgi:iron complex transport system ATP-binding protein
MDLTFDRLAVTLGTRRVLSGIDAVLRVGRVTAIIGPNGAGKSTLLRAAAALLPVAGAVRLGDEAVADMAARDRARAIGYLPQDATVHWNIRARDVVALGRVPHRSPYAAPAATDEAVVDAALVATATQVFADRPIAELSGGERARVLLARVLAGQPHWLLADEPLASLDPAHQIDMLDLFRIVAQTGGGVAIVLHDIAQAGRVADDVMVLKDGAIAAFGPAAEILTPATLEPVFGVSFGTVAGPHPICIPTGRLGR